MKKSKIMVGYKAFNEDWKCRDMQYKVGENYTFDGEPKLCSKGLHFCENPFDMFSYYPMIGSKFAEVEAKGVTDETENDSKRVAKELHIKAELTLDGIIRAGFKFIYDSVDWKKAKENTSATSGSRAHSATSGSYANSATSGDDAHSATSGSRANSATSGSYAHSATSGDDAHSATSGSYAHSATSGSRANSATSGYGAHSATSGDDAIAVAVGRKAKAKATKGCFLVLAEWYEGPAFTDAKPLAVKSVKVDGKKIKEDQWYKLVGGKFVETDDSNE
jgi:hypothetical protein